MAEQEKYLVFVDHESIYSFYAETVYGFEEAQAAGRFASLVTGREAMAIKVPTNATSVRLASGRRYLFHPEPN